MNIPRMNVRTKKKLKEECHRCRRDSVLEQAIFKVFLVVFFQFTLDPLTGLRKSLFMNQRFASIFGYHRCVYVFTPDVCHEQNRCVCVSVCVHNACVLMCVCVCAYLCMCIHTYT